MTVKAWAIRVSDHDGDLGLIRYPGDRHDISKPFNVTHRDSRAWVCYEDWRVKRILREFASRWTHLRFEKVAVPNRDLAPAPLPDCLQ